MTVSYQMTKNYKESCCPILPHYGAERNKIRGKKGQGKSCNFIKNCVCTNITTSRYSPRIVLVSSKSLHIVILIDLQPVFMHRARQQAGWHGKRVTRNRQRYTQSTPLFRAASMLENSMKKIITDTCVKANTFSRS